jgi:hypothetical protein
MNYSYTFNHMLSYEEFVEHLQPLFDNKTNWVHFWYPKEEDMKLSMKMCYQTYVERLGGFIIEFNESVLTVAYPHRVVLDRYYNQKFQPSGQRNRMGCSEDWYDCYYAITQTVHSEVINRMSDEALDALVDCVCAVQEALY